MTEKCNENIENNENKIGKIYTPPAIEEEEIFDTMALSCTKDAAPKGCSGTLKM